MEIEVLLEDADVLRRRVNGGVRHLLVPALMLIVEYDPSGEWDITSIEIMAIGPGSEPDGSTRYEWWADVEPDDREPTIEGILRNKYFFQQIEEAVAEALQADGYKPERPEGPSQKARL